MDLQNTEQKGRQAAKKCYAYGLMFSALTAAAAVFFRFEDSFLGLNGLEFLKAFAVPVSVYFVCLWLPCALVSLPLRKQPAAACGALWAVVLCAAVCMWAVLSSQEKTFADLPMLFYLAGAAAAFVCTFVLGLLQNKWRHFSLRVQAVSAFVFVMAVFCLPVPFMLLVPA